MGRKEMEGRKEEIVTGEKRVEREG